MSAADQGPLKFTGRMRLKQSSEFARVKQKGDRLVKGCLIANWLERPENSKSRLGVITSKRIGGAVVRSRARRLMREAFRQRQHSFRGVVDLVLIARRSIAGMKFEQVERDFLFLMKRAGLLKENPAAADS